MPRNPWKAHSDSFNYSLPDCSFFRRRHISKGVREVIKRKKLHLRTLIELRLLGIFFLQENHTQRLCNGVDWLMVVGGYYIPDICHMHHMRCRCTSGYFEVYLGTLGYFWVLWGTSRYFEVLLGTFRHFDVLQLTSLYIEVLLRTSEYFQVLWGNLRYF